LIIANYASNIGFRYLILPTDQIALCINIGHFWRQIGSSKKGFLHKRDRNWLKQWPLL